MTHERRHWDKKNDAAYLPIEDYGIIGDLHTVALVGRNGSIDWCCIPRFDSPSVFGALLDVQKGGFFKISPALDGNTQIGNHQIYFPDTNILITRFQTASGVAEIVDFMVLQDDTNTTQHHHIVRSVQVVRGSLPLEMVCRPAFNYARDSHTVRIVGDTAIFTSKDASLALSCHTALEQDEQGGVRARFSLGEGQKEYFVLQCAEDGMACRQHSHTDEELEGVFQETMAYWQKWISKCRYQGRWREQVRRSALVLKLLTYAPTGAIVAAATTSLPESLGGERNWDYRYTWLRDAAFTIYSLLILGFTEEAQGFMGWLDERCHELEKNGSLQPIYAIDGKHEISEEILEHLEGYCQSAPVRIGNGAAQQKQLDIYGELLDSIYIFNRYQDISYDLWRHIRQLLSWLEQHWQEPDEGIWEVRGGQKHFVHSKVMSWVAFDRALRIARHRGLPAPIGRWITISAQIYEEIMEQGWNEQRKSFVQCYGGEAVDASTLLMVLTKFMGPTDPQMLTTLETIKKDLSRDSHVYRYDPRKAATDGLSSDEGTFSPCSFWYAETLTRAGQINEARLILEKMLSYANHVGLYAEEIGPTGEALGNFPQAFTHLALISTCYNLDRALNGTLLS